MCVQLNGVRYSCRGNVAVRLVGGECDLHIVCRGPCVVCLVVVASLCGLFVLSRPTSCIVSCKKNREIFIPNGRSGDFHYFIKNREISRKIGRLGSSGSHTKFLQQISKQTKEIFRGVFFQILCYQTVDSTPPVVFFDRHGHFSFNVLNTISV